MLHYFKILFRLVQVNNQTLVVSGAKYFSDVSVWTCNLSEMNDFFKDMQEEKDSIYESDNSS